MWPVNISIVRPLGRTAGLSLPLKQAFLQRFGVRLLGADLKCTASTERHLPVFPSPKLTRSSISDVKMFGIAPV
jgi:hypothetical protein